jgi:hypothetical protein
VLKRPDPHAKVEVRALVAVLGRGRDGRIPSHRQQSTAAAEI